jgi:pyruvate,water dikinase
MVVPFSELRMTDVDAVGGKNASLGEMISQLSASRVRVPGGFATTASAFREFLAHQGLASRIAAELDLLNVDDVAALAECGQRIRDWVADAPLPPRLEGEIREHYARMVAEAGGVDVPVAVRSSATMSLKLPANA